ncbi:MAG: SAM-dependent methyltransferase [Pseudomonadota bacterium]
MQDTPLAALLRARIAADGPISIAAYMSVALGHPEHGYYATRDPLGAAGDFTTAPEISQMFGEMIGLWLAERQTSLGPETRPVLVELGPGRGTLMADALRAAPPLRSLPLWLIEISPSLRAEQAKRLASAQWAETLDAVPEAPLLLVANEFIDALPMRQYLGDGARWREVQVGLGEGGALALGLSAPLPGGPTAAPLPGSPTAAPVRGAWAEQSPAAERVMREIARRIAAHSGAALVIDYGYRAAGRPAGPTLQAVRAHARTDPLAAPGEADLTWLPDFDALATAAAPLAAFHAPQGGFLAALGIGRRAEALARARPAEAGAIADALERLTLPQAMGTRFRVLALVPAGSPAPPGFSEERTE